MAVYVDQLAEWGWIIRGRKTSSCHMFTDEEDLTSLHDVAQRIGMKRSWFQDKKAAPHYDLTPSRRAEAIKAGAIEVGRAQSVAIWRARRELMASKDLG